MRLSLEKVSNAAILFLAALAVVQIRNPHPWQGSRENAGLGAQFSAEDSVFHQILHTDAAEESETPAATPKSPTCGRVKLPHLRVGGNGEKYVTTLSSGAQPGRRLRGGANSCLRT